LTNKLCPKHNIPLVTVKGKLYCPECLRAAAIIQETQKAAQKRWRQSARGKARIKAHEQGKGKEARSRYLHSTKYKARRKEYNERIKESLQIARAQLHEAAKVEPAYTQQKLSALCRDIKDAMSWGRKPPIQDIITWGKDYELTITPQQANELIKKAREQLA
jgi:uncharacterized Zn finger protein (UPF0148 family)